MFAPQKLQKKIAKKKVGALAGGRGLVKYPLLDDGGGKRFGNLVSRAVMSLLPNQLLRKAGHNEQVNIRQGEGEYPHLITRESIGRA
jgi:hypothetical protein